MGIGWERWERWETGQEYSIERNEKAEKVPSCTGPRSNRRPCTYRADRGVRKGKRGLVRVVHEWETMMKSLGG